MTVKTERGYIFLIGDCPAGDGEELLQLLLADPAARIDWQECDSAHTAVIQLLLAAKRQIVGPPRGEVLKLIVEPAIDRALA